MRGKLLLLPRAVTHLAVVPFAAGALLPVHLVMRAEPVCPFASLTGLPCPFCGATRAFVLAGHLDGRWLSYGAVWVVAAGVALVAGRRVLRLWPVLATVLVAWAWALAHAGAITS